MAQKRIPQGRNTLYGSAASKGWKPRAFLTALKRRIVGTINKENLIYLEDLRSYCKLFLDVGNCQRGIVMSAHLRKINFFFVEQPIYDILNETGKQLLDFLLSTLDLSDNIAIPISKWIPRGKRINRLKKRKLSWI